MPETEADRIMWTRKLQRERQEEATRVANRLPLPALLSHVLVAFSIEFDNEFEHQMPHRTTNHGTTTGSHHAPWLVSLVMWSNCMQFVGEDGVTVRELERVARPETNLDGMQRWGYINVEKDSAGSRPKRPRLDAVVRLTPKGREAQDASRQLLDVIEERWQARFGKDAIDTLRELLERVVGVPIAQRSPLFRRLEPYPDGWRASVHKPDTLPHYPMVLHRGGFPDGS